MTTTPAPWPAATPDPRPDLGALAVHDPRRIAAKWAERSPIVEDPDALIDLTEAEVVHLWTPAAVTS